MKNLCSENRLVLKNDLLDRGFEMPNGVTGKHTGREVISSTGNVSGPVVPRNMVATSQLASVSSNFTADVQDSGKTFEVTSSITVTLPATILGVRLRFINKGGADGKVQITLNPNASDKIQGVDITSADNKDLVNTLATAKVGDMIELLGDGADGWLVQAISGVWTRES